MGKGHEPARRFAAGFFWSGVGGAFAWLLAFEQDGAGKEIHAAIEFVRSYTRDQIMREMKRSYTPGVKHARPNVQNAYVAPRNEPEMQIAEVWQDMLGIDQVGCFDNFFELGGDSLLATQLIANLGDMFQIELPLRALFEAPTIAELAVSIVQKQAEQMDSESLATILAELGETEALVNP